MTKNNKKSFVCMQLKLVMLAFLALVTTGSQLTDFVLD